MLLIDIRFGLKQFDGFFEPIEDTMCFSIRQGFAREIESYASIDGQQASFSTTFRPPFFDSFCLKNWGAGKLSQRE